MQITDMDISVIIPVYNAAPYLERCVRSVISFPYVQEIILIDDGSTDGSAQLCDALESEHPSLIRAIHQPNRGVSAARNRGICVSHGRWLWFVDADDYVLPVQKEKCRFEGDETFIVLGHVWDEHQQPVTYGAKPTDVPYNLWRCWFRREKINEYGLFFTLGRRYAEDQEFILSYLLSVGRSGAASVDEACYYYTLRAGSAMTQAKKSNLLHDLLSVLWGFVRKTLTQRKLSEPWVKSEMKRLLRNVYVTIK